MKFQHSYLSFEVGFLTDYHQIIVPSCFAKEQTTTVACLKFK